MLRNPAAYRASDLMKAAEERGWALVRIAGSHYVYSFPGQRALPIPMHVRGNGTKRSVIRSLMEAENG
jgi:predicted RNA binding protein YcfA (HicA-like mRNA interferase family)